MTAHAVPRRRRIDLPPAGDGSGRFLPWIIALMVYLAALALAGMMALHGAIERWDSALVGTLTVQLPPPPRAGGGPRRGRAGAGGGPSGPRPPAPGGPSRSTPPPTPRCSSAGSV